MSDFEHGTMDITDQEKTFHGFLIACRWLAYFCVAVAVFLAVFNA